MYPRTVMLKDRREVELWPMTADDAETLLEFYRSLPPEDLLYLREDVTKPDSMTRWVDDIESEQCWHLLAACEGRIVADVELDHQYYGWSQHVGEARLVVDPEFRGSGLSMLMGYEVLAQAADEGLHKVLVQMTVDQQAAVSLFQKLGFQHEALLKEHVLDQHGQLHDLIMMTYFIDNFLTQYGTALNHDKTTDDC